MRNRIQRQLPINECRELQLRVPERPQLPVAFVATVAYRHRDQVAPRECLCGKAFQPRAIRRRRVRESLLQLQDRHRPARRRVDQRNGSRWELNRVGELSR